MNYVNFFDKVRTMRNATTTKSTIFSLVERRKVSSKTLVFLILISASGLLAFIKPLVYGLLQPEPIGAYLNGNLPQNLTPQISFDVAIPGNFDKIMAIVPEPMSTNMYITDRFGKIFVVDRNSPNSSSVFLDITAKIWVDSGIIYGSTETGIFTMAFHPEFNVPGSPNRNYFYIYYVGQKNGDAVVYLSRFTRPDGSTTADPNSELVLIEQYLDRPWHRGGGILFGDDGFLYIAVGDHNRTFWTQRIDERFVSGILRIDVDMDPTRSHPIVKTLQSIDPLSFTGNYYIPNDNPWIDPSGGTFEEYYAIGCRNPHRMTKDPVTGEIYIGNVGSGGNDAIEEVNKLAKGANFGWPFREGSQPHDGAVPPDPLIGTVTDPIHEYSHNTGDYCVIGGHVYRGSQIPDLYGKYVFADYGSSKVFALDLVTGNRDEIGTFPPGRAVVVAVDQDNELYFANTNNGQSVYKLNSNGGSDSPPQWLSQTGAFSDLSTLTPTSGVISYSVNTPLWSDGAEKYRWVAIPNDGTHDTPAEQVIFSQEGEWDFPNGTVLIKHFELQTDETDPNSMKRLETRFLVRENTGNYYAMSYKWLPDGSDAELLPASLTEDITIATADGGTRIQKWFYPGNSDCFICHTSGSGRILGVKTRQLNGDHAYPQTGTTANQLESWNNIGIFNPTLVESEISSWLTSKALSDTSASLEFRARSYLDANCSGCHRPGEGGRAEFDLRLSTPLSFQRLINEPVYEDLGIAGAAVIVPGDTAKSILYQRMFTTDPCCTMPPIGRSMRDTAALKVVGAWIAGMDTIPVPPDTNAVGIWLEAECGSIGNNWTEVSDPTASNGANVIFSGPTSTSVPSGNADDIISFNIDIDQAGQYKIFGRAKTPTTNDDSYWLRVNSGNWIKWNEIAASTDWIWDQVHDNNNSNTPVLFDLNVGVNTIELSGREDGTSLDKLFITAFGEAPEGIGEPATNCVGGIPISIDPISDQSNLDGESAQLQINASGGDDSLVYAATGLPPGLTLDTQTGLISGTIDSTASNNSPYAVTITVDDHDTTQADLQTVSFNWFVFSNSASASEFWFEVECAIVGSEWTPITAADASNDTYLEAPFTSYMGAPSSDSGYHLRFDFNVVTPGQYKVFARVKAPTTDDDSYWVRANAGSWIKWNNIAPSTDWNWDQVHDNDNGDALVTFDLTAGLNTLEIAGREHGTLIDKIYVTLQGVEPVGMGAPASNCPNSSVPISISSISNQTNTEGDSVNLQVSASGGDSSLTYAATSLPPGLSLDPTSGLISGIVDSTASNASPYTVQIEVDDTDMDSTDVASTSFTWTIEQEPIPIVLDPVVDQTNEEGDTVNLAIIASGGNGALQYVASGLPPGLNIDTGTGLISGVIADSASVNSPFAVNVTVDDSDSDTTDVVNTSFLWTITATPVPIVLDLIPDQTNMDTDAVSLQVNASGGNGALVYGANGLPTGLSINPSTGLISGTIDSTASNGSPYLVNVTVDDSDSDSTDLVSTSFSWIVDPLPVVIIIDPISDQMNTEGDTISLPVMASGGDGSLQYSANNLPPGLSIDTNSGLISGVIDSAASNASPYLVNISVDDSDGDTTDIANTSFTWTIEAQPIAIVVSPVSDQINDEADTVSLAVSASGGNGALQYAASNLPSGLSIDANSGLISGVIDGSAAANSPFSVIITVDDSDSDAGDVVTTSFQWIVNVAPVPIALSPIADQTHTDADVVSLQVNASGGNGALAFSANGLPGGLSINSTTGLISGTIDSTASNGSPYAVTISVDDSDADTTDRVSTNFNWTVNPLPVSIVIDPIADQANIEGDNVSLAVTATGGDGPLVYSASGLPLGLSINASTGLISGQIDGSAADNSPYLVTITVDDSDADVNDTVNTTFNWIIDELPVPIVVNTVADQTHTESDVVSLQVSASGGNGALTYEADGLPAGLAIDPNSGLISGTIDGNASNGSPYAVVITVDDSDADTTDKESTFFSWTVNHLPVPISLSSIADQSNFEGDAVNLQVTATGGDGALVYSAIGLPPGLSISTTSGLISGTISNGAVTASPYLVTVEVDDSDADATDRVSTSFNWTVDTIAAVITDVWLEAECGTIGANWTQISDASAANGLYLLPPVGNFSGSPSADPANHISFSFEVTEAGQYRIFGRVRTPSNLDDSYWVRANGGTWVKWNGIQGGTSTFDWDQVHDNQNGNALVLFNLNPGTNTLDIAAREDGTEIDKIYITLTGSTPTGEGGLAENCLGGVPIILDPIADQSHTEGDAVFMTVQASGGEGSLNYSAINLPPGLSINSLTGEISGTVASSASAGSPYAVTITVDDTDGSSDDEKSTSFNWYIFPVSGTDDEAWLEAECATVGANWTAISDPTASQGEYLLAPNQNFNGSPSTSADDHVRFQFSLSNSGQYKVFARVIASNGGDDSFWVRANGGAWIKWNSIQSNTSFIWDQVHDNNNGNSFVEFSLQAGINSVDFAGRENGTILDKIYITQIGSEPVGEGDASTNCATPQAGLVSGSQSTSSALQFDLQIEAYPNPLTTAGGMLNLTFDQPVGNPVSFTFTDMQGRRIQENVVEMDGAGHSGQIAIKPLPAGIYMLIVHGDNFMQMKRIKILGD